MKYFIPLLLIFSSCQSSTERFFSAHRIDTLTAMPLSFDDGRWEPLEFDYKYLTETFEVNGQRRALIIIGNASTQEITAFCDITNNLLVLDKVPIRKGRTYEYFYEDNKKEIDMTSFNRLLYSMPEMQDFSWKNLHQNRMIVILSNIYLFTGIRETLAPEDSTKNPESVSVSREQRTQNIIDSKHSLVKKSMYYYNAGKQPKTYLMVYNMGFRYENEPSKAFYENDTRTLGVLMKSAGIVLATPKEKIFYYPFYGYVYDKGNYTFLPSIRVVKMSHKMTADLYPEFSINSSVLSLLD